MPGTLITYFYNSVIRISCHRSDLSSWHHRCSGLTVHGATCFRFLFLTLPLWNSHQLVFSSFQCDYNILYRDRDCDIWRRMAHNFRIQTLKTSTWQIFKGFLHKIAFEACFITLNLLSRNLFFEIYKTTSQNELLKIRKFRIHTIDFWLKWGWMITLV